MSQLNFTRKTFLEREELIRLQEFLRDDIAFNAIVGNTRQYGIIQTEFVGSDTNFQVGTGTNSGTIQIAKEQSQALDIDGNLIRLPATDNIAVTDDSNWYWVRISHTFRRYEDGTVSINTNGQLTGTDTTFTEVLRGQATDVPVRIRFVELDGTTPSNNGTYEVVNVVDNTNAVLTSVTAFQAESNLRYIVIGSTPIGEIVSTEQLTGLYQYDSCLVELVAETTANTPPALPANGANRYFYVARVMNVGGTVTIQDRREPDENYWQFNVPGVIGAIVNRTLPAPTVLNNYMMLGYITKSDSQFAYFLYTGTDTIQGYIAWIRLNRINAGGLDIGSANVIIIRDASDNDRNPTFFVRNNTTDNRFELWVKSASETGFPAAGFTPGTIALVSENLTGAATSWEYADSFTWSSTVPTSITAAETVYAVYSADVTNSLDTVISNINTRITNNTNNITELNADTGYLDLTNQNPGGELVGIIVRVRQKGDTVNISGTYGFDNNTSDLTGSFTIGSIPTSVTAPVNIVYGAATRSTNNLTFGSSIFISSGSRLVRTTVNIPANSGSVTQFRFNVTYIV